MNEFVEVLGELLNEPSAITVQYQHIDNLHKLILDELPYGQIDPNSLVQGTIEIDGPAQDPPNAKKPLQWHFGGEACEIAKAIRIQYAYEKTLDGAQIYASGSLFIGYDTGTPYTDLLAAHIKELDADAKRLEAEAKPEEAAEARSRHQLAENVRALRSRSAEAPAGLSRVDKFVAALESAYATNPMQVTRLARYVDSVSFDSFVEENIPFLSPSRVAEIKDKVNETGKTGMAKRFKIGPRDLSTRLGVRVEFDGPARGYDSKKPFPYTTDSLFNDPSGLYNQLLWWYFGGKAFRITKAMRMDYEGERGTQILLIGYQGPGPI